MKKIKLVIGIFFVITLMGCTASNSKMNNQNYNNIESTVFVQAPEFTEETVPAQDVDEQTTMPELKIETLSAYETYEVIEASLEFLHAYTMYFDYFINDVKSNPDMAYEDITEHEETWSSCAEATDAILSKLRDNNPDPIYAEVWNNLIVLYDSMSKAAHGWSNWDKNNDNIYTSTEANSVIEENNKLFLQVGNVYASLIVEQLKSLPVPEKTLSDNNIGEGNSETAYSAFIAATNMTTKDLIEKSDGLESSYYYKNLELLPEDVEWIEHPLNKEGSVNQGAIYRMIAKLLADFKATLNDGSSFCTLLTGTTYSSRDEFENYTSNAEEFICTENSLYHVLRKFETLESVDGFFDFPNSVFHFSIDDLTTCAKEMQISEEMLGYIIAMMEEYAFTFLFEGNSCTFDYAALHDFGWN